METKPDRVETAVVKPEELPRADSDAAPRPRLCSACCGELPAPGASICLRCNSPQGWRRYLVISDTSLSLLIALFSVITVGAPSLLRMLQTDREDVQVIFTGIDGSGQARLFAFNAGSRPGVIAPRGHAVQVVQAFSEAGTGKRSVSLAMPVTLFHAETPEETGILVAPGGSVLMRVSVGTGALWATTRRDLATCWLEMTTDVYGVESQYRRGRSVDASPRRIRVVLHTRGLMEGECLLARNSPTPTADTPGGQAK